MMSIASCTKSEDMVDPNAAGGMTLRFVSNTLTRVEGTNDNQNSEDDIKTVDIYFYAGDGSSAAVSHVAPDITDGEDGNASLRGENELKLTSGVVNSLFPAGGSASATLYVVANAPAGLLPTSGTLPTLAELKSITSVLTSWKTSAEGAAPSSYQTSFLMDGSATFQKSTQELTIELTRAAAKFDLEISSIEDEVNIEIAGGVTETWEPVIDAEHPVTVSFFMLCVRLASMVLLLALMPKMPMMILRRDMVSRQLLQPTMVRLLHLTLSLTHSIAMLLIGILRVPMSLIYS